MNTEKHKSAVKALAWSTAKRNVFVSGGGKDDRRLYVWDINNSQSINSLHLRSQICNIDYTCDGYLAVSCGQVNSTDEENSGYDDVYLIDPKQMKVLAQFEGHFDRVVYSAMNRDRTILYTASGDETVRTWDVRNKITQPKRSLLQQNQDKLSVSLR